MADIFITAIVFTGIFQVIKVFTDYLLKRKIISSGKIDAAAVLEPPVSREENSYPTLKWGLVALFAGLGLLLISILGQGQNTDWFYGTNAYMPLGIELVALSLGFLLYFFIARRNVK